MSVTLFTMNGTGEFQNRGRAVAVCDWNPLVKVRLTDWTDGFKPLSAIMQRIAPQEQTNHQFLHTLGDDIYLYVFGDRIGQLGLSGLTVNDNCTNPSQEAGISKVIRWYREHRVTVRREPLEVTYQPGVNLKGFLVDFRGDVVDPCQRLYQFYLTLALIPERRKQAQ